MCLSKITKKCARLDSIIITSYKILEDYNKDDVRYLSFKNDFWNAVSNILVSKFKYTIKYIDNLVREKGGVEMTFSEKVLEKGEKIGIEKGQKETAKNMLKEGLDIKLISKITGLSVDDINNL